MKRLFLVLLVVFLFGCSSSDSKKESINEDSKSTEEVQDSTGIEKYKEYKDKQDKNKDKN